MSITPDSPTPLNRKATALLFLALVVAGLAGNLFKYELFFNIQFIFGSIFALLALQMLGFGLGILAATLISGATYLLWNHPYAIIIMTAEVIAVGWLCRRQGRIGMVLACALYWLCLGMPLVYLFYHGVMHLPASTALITMVKQAINGIANALVARLLFMAISISAKQQTTFSFREIIFHLLTLFVLGPSLFILTQESKTEFAETDQAIRETLIHSSARTAHSLDSWLQGHLTQIAHLAKMASSNEATSLQRGIEEIHSGDQDFLRVGLVDNSATVVAFSPLHDDLGQPNLGRNFADRPFIPILKQTLRPMFSEVVMGRINRPEPVVSMLAPVVKNGVYDGYAIGVLDLQRLHTLIDVETADQGLNYALLDRHGKVIISNREDLKTMEAFVREAGELRQMDNGINQWVPPSKKNISISERWKKSSYIKETTIGPMAEWQLILEQPVAPFQERLYKRYSEKLGLLLLVLAVALTMAEIISRSLIISLERVNALSTDLPQKLLSADQIVWPQSAVMESENLLANFRVMAQALSEKFHEIKELNENLENRIQQRTQEALQLASRYQTLMMTATDGIHIVDEQGNVVEANDSFCRMLGYTRDEMLRLNVTDWEALFSPEEVRAGIPKLIEHPALLSTKHRRKDGEIRDVEISAGGVTIDGQPLLFTASRDITDRKRAEKEREQFFTFFQTSTDMMCIADPNGAFLRTNPACSELLGYSTEELVSKPFVDFIHPDDKQPTIDEMARQIERGYSLNFENRYLCQDGSYRWLSWRANYNKDEGLTYATARDITERKHLDEELREAKELFELLFSTNPDAALISRIDDGYITHINDVFIELFGYSRTELIGSTTLTLQLWTADDRQRFVDELRARGYCRNLEFLFRKKDGSTFCGSLSANVTNLQGIPHIVSSTRDITARKQAEETLVRSLKEKEVMLKEIHHRVKNNMQVVYSLLNLQAKTIVNPATRALFEESRNRVSSMALIHEKLYRSADLSSIDFKDYLQSLVTGIAGTYNRPDIDFVVDMPSLILDVNTGIPCGLIVNELTSNSLKHAFPDGRQGRITLGINKDSQGDNVLTFADNGIGFPPELDFKTTSSLGLQLVTVLAEQLHGTIELWRDEGTKFIITFPGA